MEQSPAFSRDGRVVAYIRGTAGFGDLRVADVATGESRSVGAGGDAGTPDWMPNGNDIVFAARGGVNTFHDIARVSATGGGFLLLTAGPSDDTEPDVSADGTRIAYTSARPGLRAQVWVLDLRTGETAPATAEPGTARNPRWTPDGRIAYLASPVSAGDASVFVTGADGRGRTAIPATERATSIDVSPAGRLAFARDGDVWTAELDGTGVRNATRTPHVVDETTPAWQPAGGPAPRPARPCALTGTAGDDVIVGSAYDDVILDLGGDDVGRAGAGNDRIYDGGGNDLVHAGSGDDEVRLRGGANAAFGEGGSDLLSASAAPVLPGVPDRRQRLDGGAGTDAVLGSPLGDVLAGGDGRDYVWGGRGGDAVSGGSGGDRLDGAGGNDVVSGGTGRDVVLGGAGDDRLLARDRERDVLSGGGGRDAALRDRFDVVHGVERLLAPR